MARKPIQKELQGTRLLKEYASWVYCLACGNTVAYLCYVTYDEVELNYTCNCGNCGRVFIRFAHDAPEGSDQPLLAIKNRLCCPADHAPLLTIVEKNVQSAQVRVLCNGCHKEYENEYKQEDCERGAL